jgi:hypothetical protein
VRVLCFGQPLTCGWCPGKVCSNFRAAWRIMMSNEKVLLLGIIQSCFEAAMYIFVFMWTPALESNLPEGETVRSACQQ